MLSVKRFKSDMRVRAGLDAWRNDPEEEEVARWKKVCVLGMA